MTDVTLQISTETASELSSALAAAIPSEPPAETEEPSDIAALLSRIDELEARKIWFGETPTGGERVLNMVATSGSPYNFYVVYSLPLPDVKEGDLIEAFSQWEVTSENANEYMIGCLLTIADSSTDNTVAVEKRLSLARTENLLRLVHHMRLNEHGMVRATSDMTGKFINLIGYCGRIGGAGATIRVEPGYGSLEVKVTPASMLA